MIRVDGRQPVICASCGADEMGCQGQVRPVGSSFAAMSVDTTTTVAVTTMSITTIYTVYIKTIRICQRFFYF